MLGRRLLVRGFGLAHRVATGCHAPPLAVKGQGVRPEALTPSKSRSDKVIFPRSKLRKKINANIQTVYYFPGPQNPEGRRARPERGREARVSNPAAAAPQLHEVGALAVRAAEVLAAPRTRCSASGGGATPRARARGPGALGAHEPRRRAHGRRGGGGGACPTPTHRHRLIDGCGGCIRDGRLGLRREWIGRPARTARCSPLQGGGRGAQSKGRKSNGPHSGPG